MYNIISLTRFHFWRIQTILVSPCLFICFVETCLKVLMCHIVRNFWLPVKFNTNNLSCSYCWELSSSGPQFELGPFIQNTKVFWLVKVWGILSIFPSTRFEHFHIINNNKETPIIERADKLFFDLNILF